MSSRAIAVLVVVAALIGPPAARADDAREDFEEVASWASTAALAARGWMAGTLPQHHAGRTLSAAADALLDLSRSRADACRKQGSADATCRAQFDRIDAIRIAVERVGRAVERADKGSAARDIEALDRAAAAAKDSS